MPDGLSYALTKLALTKLLGEARPKLVPNWAAFEASAASKALCWALCWALCVEKDGGERLFRGSADGRGGLPPRLGPRLPPRSALSHARWGGLPPGGGGGGGLVLAGLTGPSAAWGHRPRLLRKSEWRWKPRRVRKRREHSAHR